MSLSRGNGQTPSTPALTDFTTELAPEYCARRDSLLTTFPAAHRFLSDLEALCSRGLGFHLGTTKNLHLYLGPRFLCYIKIEKPAALLLSPEPNVSIKVGTRPDPGCLFPRPVDRLVVAHKGFSAKWATRTEDKFKVLPGAPEAFFHGLLHLIEGIA